MDTNTKKKYNLNKDEVKNASFVITEDGMASAFGLKNETIEVTTTSQNHNKSLPQK